MDVQVVSRRPFSMPPKHCQRCICSVSRPAWCNSGWGLHFLDHPITSQSSQRSSRFHKPAVSRAALGTATSLRPRRRSGTIPRRSTQCEGGRCYCDLQASARQAMRLPPCSNLCISFVMKFCRGSTGWRIHFGGTAQAARVAQRRGTTSRTSLVQVQILPRAPTFLR